MRHDGTSPSRMSSLLPGLVTGPLTGPVTWPPTRPLTRPVTWPLTRPVTGPLLLTVLVLALALLPGLPGLPSALAPAGAQAAAPKLLAGAGTAPVATGPLSPSGTSPGPAVPPAAVTPVPGEVTLSVDALEPEVIHDGEDLQVSGTIANGTGSPLSGTSLVVQVQEHTEVTFEALSLWLIDERDSPLSESSVGDLPQEIPAGQVVPFSLTLSAEDLPLSDGDQWGPRGVQVTLTDGGTTVAADRSVVVWDASATVDPARVTTIVPVTASTEELAALTLPASAQSSSGSGPGVTRSGVQQRIQGLLGLAGDGVVLAVDPALLEALGLGAGTTQGDPGGSGEPTDGTSTATPSGSPSASPGAASGSGAGALASSLAQAVADGEVVALPWDDLDISSLAHLGEEDLLETSLQRTRDSAAAGAGADTSVAWMASSTLDARTLEALPESVTTVVAPPGSLPAVDSLTYTPSGTTVADGRTVLLPEEQVSLALAGLVQREDGDDVQALSDLDARQLLRGQTAIFTRQAPSVGRDLVVALDRASGAATDPDVLSQRLAALRDTSWTTPQDLGGLGARAVQDAEQAADGGWVARMEPEPEVVEADELASVVLSQAYTTGGRLDSIATVLSDPAAALGRSNDVESVIASASWRHDPAARGTYLTSAETAGTEVVGAVRAAPSSTVNIINSEANMPVRIDSALDQEVTVRVHLVPDSQRLQVPDTATVTIPARGQATATVPVRAVGSGDVTVTVEILSADGVAAGTPATVDMRVRAAWESVGTGVVGGVLALILVTGVVRTVRRGRRATGPIPAAQELPAQEKA